MTIEGVDFSYGRPGGAALAAAGKKFVVRYITGAGKALTAAEIRDYQGHGLGICLVFESTAARALAGEAAGRNDAASTITAKRELGIPDWVPCHFAVDFDPAGHPGSLDTIVEYLGGAAAVIGKARAGVYGGYAAVNAAARAGVVGWFWQTYAWSYGRIHSAAHLHQYRNGQKLNGAAVDLCRALKSDYGAWTGLPDTSTGEPMALPITSTTPKVVALTVGDKLFDTDGALLTDVKAATTRPSPYEVKLNGVGHRVIHATVDATGVARMVLVRTSAVTLTDVPPTGGHTDAELAAAIAKAKAEATAAEKARLRGFLSL